MQPEYGASPEALVGEARRQATGLFKGVDFQVWLTISAWVNLQEEQVIVVEGVEDFDVVTDKGGITTQAKALADPISLRSASVTDAIRNYWIAKHSNPGRQVQYRFVTTASLAVETGGPFGDEVQGLAVWSREARLKNRTEASEKLRRFLVEDASVRERLVDRLLDSADEKDDPRSFSVRLAFARQYSPNSRFPEGFDSRNGISGAD